MEKMTSKLMIYPRKYDKWKNSIKLWKKMTNNQIHFSNNNNNNIDKCI